MDNNEGFQLGRDNLELITPPLLWLQDISNELVFALMIMVYKMSLTHRLIPLFLFFTGELMAEPLLGAMTVVTWSYQCSGNRGALMLI